MATLQEILAEVDKMHKAQGPWHPATPSGETISSGESMYQPDLLQQFRMALPLPVEDALSKAGQLAALAKSLGASPEGVGLPGESLAATPLMGKWAGVEKSLGEMETGLPFTSHTWRVGDPRKNGVGSFWVDALDVKPTRDAANTISSIVGQTPVGKNFENLIQGQKTINNPLVIPGDQHELMSQLGLSSSDVWAAFKKSPETGMAHLDGIDNITLPAGVAETLHKITKGALHSEKSYAFNDTLLGGIASELGHDAIIYKEGNTINKTDSQVWAPELHYLGE